MVVLEFHFGFGSYLVMALIPLDVKIVGVSALIMHNGQTADPMNKFAKAMKVITSKGKNKTDEDYAELSRIEWNAGLYLNSKGEIYVPADCIEATILNGAKKSKLGPKFKSGVFLGTDEPSFEFGVKKKTPDAIIGNDEFRFVRLVAVNGSKIVRTRPIFRAWSSTFQVMYDSNMVNKEQVVRAIQDAGEQIGLCDYRPRYGRFTVEVF